MPDATDRKNIVEMIKTYDTAFPYPHPLSIGKAIESALSEIDNRFSTTKMAGSTRNESKGGNVRRTSLPLPFMVLLKKAYPTIISNESHYHWFLGNFPALDLLQYESHEKYHGLEAKQ